MKINKSSDSVTDIGAELLSRATERFPDSKISGELVSVPNDVVYRIRHEDVVNKTHSWQAVVALCTVWTAPDGERVLKMDNIGVIVARYDLLVSQASDLGIISPVEFAVAITKHVWVIKKDKEEAKEKDSPVEQSTDKP